MRFVYILIAAIVTIAGLSVWSLSWITHPVQIVSAITLIVTCVVATILLVKDDHAPKITYWQRMDAMLDRNDRWRCYECGVEFTAAGRNWPYRITEPHRKANPNCKALNFERIRNNSTT